MHSITSSALPTARPERRVHRGQHGLACGTPSRVADRDHRLAPARARRRSVFMNAPRPHFTSSTRASMPSAIFLLMIDAEISGMLSTVPVTSRSAYSFLSAGAISVGLTDQRAADSREGATELVQRQADAEAGNRLELVERAAGVAEAAAGHHRHDDAARGDERRQDQRRLVADAAGAVLVDLDARNAETGRRAARAHHRVGQPGGLLRRHAAEDDRHQQGRGLVIGHGAVGHAGDERSRSRRV